jgi:hypothetical protein
MRSSIQRALYRSFDRQSPELPPRTPYKPEYNVRMSGAGLRHILDERHKSRYRVPVVTALSLRQRSLRRWSLAHAASFGSAGSAQQSRRSSTVGRAVAFRMTAVQRSEARVMRGYPRRRRRHRGRRADPGLGSGDHHSAWIPSDPRGGTLAITGQQLLHASEVHPVERGVRTPSCERCALPLVTFPKGGRAV